MSSAHSDDSLPLLSEPAEGVPELISTQAQLTAAAQALTRGTGPVGVDAERASGIRYGNRAFLVQLRRAGAGTLLIDPEALPDLSPIDEALRGVEWVLHAATQDLPCLADTGLTPDQLFDTELAARILGCERFGLAAVVGDTVGVRLAKEHSNVDWSLRPLPADWLNYAALDVELLAEVREQLAERLRSTGKDEFARQEFTHLLGFQPTVHSEPWRRVNGAGAVRTRRGLARVRSLWTFRDRLAQRQDIAPGRIIRDRQLVELAQAQVRTPRDLQRITGVNRLPKPTLQAVFKAMRDADALPDQQLPSRRSPDAEPGGSVDRTIVKSRLDEMKPAIAGRAAELDLPHDIVLSPRTVRALAAQRRIGGPEDVAEFLRLNSARPWQIEHTADILSEAAQAADSTA